MTKMITASDLSGPADLYEVLLNIKNKAVGCFTLTKKQAKQAGIEWSFVENACKILGLKLSNKTGRLGHNISL